MKHKFTLLLTIATLIVAGFFFENSYFVYVVSGIILLYLLILVAGAGLIQLNYFVNSINKGSKKGVSITFDDGPDAVFTPQILDILKAEKVKATFFVIGNKIEKEKELLKRIHSEEHIIGNHSFSHTKKLTTAPTKFLIEDFEKCSTTIENIIQQKPLFFRPPFGVTNPKYKRALTRLNLKSIGWSVRSLDTKTTNASELYNSTIKKIKTGSIILFHDTQKVTLEILPDIIKYCKNNGINIVPLSDLINEKAYA